MMRYDSDTRTFAIRIRRVAMLVATFAFAAGATLVLAPHAGAVTLSSPKQNEKLDQMDVYPTFVVEPAAGERPKWILISQRSDMERPIRYCRMFYGVYSTNGVGWACRSLAVGVDQWGRDIVRPLEEGKRYYWNVVYTVAEKDRTSATRAFSIRRAPAEKSIAAISKEIMGDAAVAGLNSGKAAPSRSGVRVKSIKSRQTHRKRIVITVRYTGRIYLRHSWVTVKGPGGTHKLRLKGAGPGTLKAVFRRPAASAKKKNARHPYQAHLISRKNQARVRSQENVILFRHRA